MSTKLIRFKDIEKTIRYIQIKRTKINLKLPFRRRHKVTD